MGFVVDVIQLLNENIEKNSILIIGMSLDLYFCLSEEILPFMLSGVFVQDEDTRLVLFNRHSLESLEQYRLIGVILGLAIYNQCLVDVRFPSFIYKKLLGRRANLLDMKDVYPVRDSSNLCLIF